MQLYFAEQIYQAISGATSDHAAIIRILVLRSEVSHSNVQLIIFKMFRLIFKTFVMSIRRNMVGMLSKTCSKLVPVNFSDY